MSLIHSQRILVLGHAQHGKGTFCQLLKQAYGICSLSSSEVALPHILPVLISAREIWADPNQILITPEYAYARRDRCRILWKEAILLLNTPDRTTLTRLILQQAPVYDGMRSIDEYREAWSLFDVIYWVDASERKPLDPSMEIPYEDNMHWIDNNGSLEDLKSQVLSLGVEHA